jgi:hypothetical protein
VTARLLDQHKEVRDALFDARLALGLSRRVVAELEAPWPPSRCTSMPGRSS